VRQVTVIDRQPTIIDQLQQWWRQDRRIHKVQPTWACQAALAGVTPAELLASHTTNGEAILGGLVRLAADDDLAAMAAVMILLPAAKGLMSRLPDPRQDRDERSAGVVAQLFALVRTYPWWSRKGTVAGNISADLLKWMVRDRPKVVEVAAAFETYSARYGCTEKHGRSEPSLGELQSELHGDRGLRMAEPADASLDSLSSGEELIEILAGAVHGGVLSVAEAKLIAARRIGGVSAEELAARRGVKAQSVRRSWQRAERTLVEATQQGVLVAA
jgi:hypothetical protein